MFDFDKQDIQRFAISAVGALAMSAAGVLAAAAPAKAATPTAALTVADWQHSVAARIEAVHEAATVYQPASLTAAEVEVRFTAEGDFAGATIARSSGNRQIDARAVAVARAIRYPMLPDGMRGAPANVRMMLYFGSGADAAAEYALERDRAARNIQVAGAGSGNGIQLAAR